MDPVSNFIAAWKIPVGQWGKAVIDFIITYFQWFFDALVSGRSNCVVEGIDLSAAAISAGRAGRRARGSCLLAAEITEAGGRRFASACCSSSTRACGRKPFRRWCWWSPPRRFRWLIGVPLGIWAAHKPRVWQITAADPRPDADHADLRLSHSHSHPVRPRRGPGPHRHHHLRHAGPGAHDLSGHHLDPQAHARSGRKLSAPPSGNCCGRWNCRRRCPRSWRASRNASCCRFPWWCSPP